MRGEPEVYFGMDFLVEADIDAACNRPEKTPEPGRPSAGRPIASSNPS